MQKTTLHHLLMIKHELDRKNISSAELDKYISVTIAAMEAEDVAYVQKVLESFGEFAAILKEQEL